MKYERQVAPQWLSLWRSEWLDGAHWAASRLDGKVKVVEPAWWHSDSHESEWWLPGLRSAFMEPRSGGHVEIASRLWPQRTNNGIPGVAVEIACHTGGKSQSTGMPKVNSLSTIRAHFGEEHFASKIAEVAAQSLSLADSWLRVEDSLILADWVFGDDDYLRRAALTSPFCSEELKVAGVLLNRPADFTLSSEKLLDEEFLARSVVISVIANA